MHELPSTGLGESQSDLLSRIKRRGEATLAELEGETGLARETLRDHCKSLAAHGFVERAGVRRDGPGRPEVVYRVAAGGDRLFPRREGVLLRELAGFLREEGRDELLERFFDRRRRRKREELDHRVSGLGTEERLSEVAKILSEEGYLAEAETGRDGGRRLRLCHCPLRDLVAVSHLPCRAEMALVSDLLGEPLAREEFMPDGGACCSYRLTPNDAAGAAAVEAGRPD